MLKHHRQPKDLDGAIVGEDLPPFHPNCKCTIGSYVDSGNEEPDDGVGLMPTLYDFDKTMAVNGKKYKEYIKLFEDAYNHKYKTASSLVYDNQKLRYNENFIQSLCLINGEPLMPLNVTNLDVKLLDLMKEIEKCQDPQTAESLIRKGYKLLVNSPRNNATIDFFKPLSYYEVGRDVTREIDDMMEDYIQKYGLAKLGIEPLAITVPIDLLVFYNLVKNNGELDLKNREAYKSNSTYILNGTIVDRDALGNYTYGYFGSALNIPSDVLLAMGGYAQIQANTSSPDFITTFGDDPRDQYMILEGIKAYERSKK